MAKRLFEEIDDVFNISRIYPQWEVQAVIGKMEGNEVPISSRKFRESYRTRKGFPKPMIDKGTNKSWSGLKLFNYFNKA